MTRSNGGGVPRSRLAASTAIRYALQTATSSRLVVCDGCLSCCCPQIPWAGRGWALPFLTVLAPSERYTRELRQRHKKLTDWGRQMLLQTARRLPDRRIVGVTNSSFAAIGLLNDVRRALRVQSTAAPIRCGDHKSDYLLASDGSVREHVASTEIWIHRTRAADGGRLSRPRPPCIVCRLRERHMAWPARCGVKSHESADNLTERALCRHPELRVHLRSPPGIPACHESLHCVLDRIFRDDGGLVCTDPPRPAHDH